MNLHTSTITTLLALANKILEQYGDELVAIFRAAGTIQAPAVTEPPPPTPVPLPEPLPPDFDEAFYLATYSDVRAAVGPGKPFATGGDHYLLHGRAEGRIYARPLIVPTPTPTPTPVDVWVPKAAYASAAQLLNDLTMYKCQQAVTLDGHSLYSGFGPALQYHRWADGTVRTEDSGQLSLPLESGTGEVIDLR